MKVIQNDLLVKSLIGLVKMFSPWILGIFNIQIQSESGCGLFCVLLLTDKRLKGKTDFVYIFQQCAFL